MEMKWISIALAALAAVVLGYVWHNIIFENVGQEPNEHRLPNTFYMPIAFVLNMLIAYGLYGYIVDLHNYFNSLSEVSKEVTEHPFFHGALHGTLHSFFYGVVSVLILTALLNGKGFKWILSTVIYWVLAIALMGGVIGFMA